MLFYRTSCSPPGTSFLAVRLSIPLSTNCPFNFQLSTFDCLSDFRLPCYLVPTITGSRVGSAPLEERSCRRRNRPLLAAARAGSSSSPAEVSSDRRSPLERLPRPCSTAGPKSFLASEGVRRAGLFHCGWLGRSACRSKRRFRSPDQL